MATITLAYARKPQDKYKLMGYFGTESARQQFDNLPYVSVMRLFADYVQQVGVEGNSFKFIRLDRATMRPVDITDLAMDLLNNPEETISKLDNPPVVTIDMRKKKESAK